MMCPRAMWAAHPRRLQAGAARAAAGRGRVAASLPPLTPASVHQGALLRAAGAAAARGARKRGAPSLPPPTAQLLPAETGQLPVPPPAVVEQALETNTVLKRHSKKVLSQNENDQPAQGERILAWCHRAGSAAGTLLASAAAAVGSAHPRTGCRHRVVPCSCPTRAASEAAAALAACSAAAAAAAAPSGLQAGSRDSSTSTCSRRGSCRTSDGGGAQTVFAGGGASAVAASGSSRPGCRGGGHRSACCRRAPLSAHCTAAAASPAAAPGAAAARSDSDAASSCPSRCTPWPPGDHAWAAVRSAGRAGHGCRGSDAAGDCSSPRSAANQQLYSTAAASVAGRGRCCGVPSELLPGWRVVRRCSAAAAAASSGSSAVLVAAGASLPASSESSGCAGHGQANAGPCRQRGNERTSARRSRK